MTAQYFAICQRTPFPGFFEPIPEWQLQHAELRLGLNVLHYYERARRVGNVLTYSTHRRDPDNRILARSNALC